MENTKIKKFTGHQEDYQAWRRDLVAALVIKDLGYIAKAAKMPTGNDKEAVRHVQEEEKSK